MKWIFALLLITGCSSTLKKPQPSDLLSPYGTYQHKVRVQILEPLRTLDLRGVMQSTANDIKVVGLSTFNTTLFRIHEDRRTGVIEKEFYVDTIRQNEERFMSFYALTKEVLLAPKGQTEFTRGGAHFLLSNQDENGLYRTVKIQHPQVNLTIEITGYDF